MKLAEALSIRADLQKKAGQLKNRMKDSAKTQEFTHTHFAYCHESDLILHYHLPTVFQERGWVEGTLDKK